MKLAKSYEPGLHEQTIYGLWEKATAFKPQGTGQPYSVVVPPPNANGNLHLGHALAFALQDIDVRYHRAKGDKVLFVPGADHAGFETQVVFERQLAAEGKSRFDYSREGLYDHIFSFVQQNRTNFENQIRRLGASVDWSHYTFTLDEKVVKQAYATFHKMWDEGLIYRSERLVNFCTFHGTAFADIEIVYREEQGSMWQILYPLVDGSGSITVATTRPETLLGDTAVAVNPRDERYSQLIGKSVKLPLTNREIPIIADSYVDPEFGTGAVKITPAHDPNDYEIGQRHDLPFMTVIGFDGLMTDEAGERFRGLTIAAARQKIVQELKGQGLLVKVIKHTHNVGHCYKCDTIIEPLLKEQWFIDMQPLAQKAIVVLQQNRISFYPTNKRQQLIRYLENLKDWNISRQIAWGIPIPAFQNENDPGDWIFDTRVKEEVITVNNRVYRRDPDVFDTWFSSASWPYVTLDYPDSRDFAEFYPLSLMETGFDILMQWVGRMLMMGLYTTGKIPFKTVYLHGLVLDAHGQKMSKSKGNVIDPMQLIDTYGSDALRLGVISGQTPGHNQPIIPSKIVGGRNFCNKLWNIARFIESIPDSAGETSPETPADHWILERYHKTLDKYQLLLDNYRYSETYELIHGFIWDDLADWYVETAKIEPNSSLLIALIRSTLVMAHPFAPFVTETIWQAFEQDSKILLSGHPFISLPVANHKQANRFAELKRLVVSIRSILQSLEQKPANASIYFTEQTAIDSVPLVKSLTRVSNIHQIDKSKGVALLPDNPVWWIDIDREAVERYKTKVQQLIKEEQSVSQRLSARLENRSYTDNAPRHLVKETRDQLQASQDKLKQLRIDLKRF